MYGLVLDVEPDQPLPAESVPMAPDLGISMDAETMAIQANSSCQHLVVPPYRYIVLQPTAAASTAALPRSNMHRL